jgi:hypothetical protein
MQNKSSLPHSLRGATIGSTPAARHAGSADASNAASPNANVADVSMTGSQVLKANSSRWMKEHGVARFEWQEGYFACSVSRSQVATIRQYVVNQKDHHFRMDFAKEFKLLAKKHGFEVGIEGTTKLVVPSPKWDSVSVGFRSRHSRAGLWILPSLSGLVCGRDLRSRLNCNFAGSVKETTHPAGLMPG